MDFSYLFFGLFLFWLWLGGPAKPQASSPRGPITALMTDQLDGSTTSIADPSTPTSKMKQGKISGFYSTRRSGLRHQAKTVVQDKPSDENTTDKDDDYAKRTVGGGMVGFVEDTPAETTDRSGEVRAPTKRKAQETAKKVDKDIGRRTGSITVDDENVLLSNSSIKRGAVKATPSKDQSSYEAPAEPFAVSAHERLSTLLTPTSATRLALPVKLQLLQRIHSALETVFQLMADRDQPAVFHRCKKAAENIVGREITVEHMRQIFYLLGEDSYQFKPAPIVHMGKRLISLSVSFGRKLTQSELVQRRDTFHSALIDHVRATHDAFLAEIGVKLPADAKLRSWHPKFDLDSIPDVPLGDLSCDAQKPTPPVKTPTQVKDAIREVERESLSATPTPSPKKKTISSSGGKPMSLLERIKAKEAEQQAKEMTGQSSRTADPELAVLSDFAQNLAFLFGSSGKGAIPLADVTTKLKLANSASSTELVDRIKRLADMVPEWVQLVQSGPVQIVKMNKSYGVKRALSDLSAKLTNSV